MHRLTAVVLWTGLMLLSASPTKAGSWFEADGLEIGVRISGICGCFGNPPVVIVDTGTPPDPTQGISLFDSQWVAGEFTTTESDVITSIEGYIVDRFVSGSFTVGLYTDGGEVPGLELLSGAATAMGGADWYGLTSLNYLLLPGTYWVTFEVRPGDTFDGYMPSATPFGSGAPSPLANEALFHFEAVSEPSMLTLLALAALGLGVFRRKY